MEKGVQSRVDAQEGSQKDRRAKFNEARGVIREVVVKLMAERQKLYRRMQIAKIAAQVRELIVIETKTMKTTASLPERRTEERDRLTPDGPGQYRCCAGRRTPVGSAQARRTHAQRCRHAQHVRRLARGDARSD
mgnify:CR=1 FL=1